MSNFSMDYYLDTKVTTAPGETSRIEKIIDFYKQSVDFSCPISGTIRKYENSNVHSLHVNYRHCDGEFAKWRYSSKQCNFTRDEATRSITNIGHMSQGHGSHEVIIDVTSQNGKYRAKLLITELLPYKERQQILEIWVGDKHVKTFEVAKIDAHGLICIDGCFKSMEWSSHGEQNKLIYVALDTKHKSRTFFSINDPEPSTSTAAKKPSPHPDVVSRGFRYKPHWGEATNDTIHTCIAVLDVPNDCKINVIKGEFQTLMEPVLCDNNTKIACIGVDTGPRKLGLIYCNNRPSNVVVFTIDSGVVMNVDNLFTLEDNMSIHDLRIDRTGYKLLFAANPIYGAHHQPSSLYMVDLRTPNLKTIRPIDTNRLCLEKVFNLPHQGIPTSCFSQDNKYIYIPVETKMRNELLRINTETHGVEKIATPTKVFEVFDVNHNHILLSCSAIDQRPTLYFTSLDRLDRWSQTLEEVYIDKTIKCDYDEMLDHSDHLSLSVAYIRPTTPRSLQVKQLPTVVMVHGGPHSSFSLGYSPIIHFYNKLKMRMLLLNYRGSSGYDRRHTDSLLGNIGFHDVRDCIRLILHFKDKFDLNMDKLAIHGGSHGGFLAAHLSCQKEIKFKCAIMRNPVIDLYSMYVTSDIPDWVLAEAINADQPEMHLSPDMLEMLYNKSPSRKQLSIVSPTLLMLGKNDKRVPMSQGLLWAHALRRQNVDVEIRAYDDKHDLYKLDVYSDSILCSALFLLKYLYR